MQLERTITENGSNVYDIADFWGSIRLCFDIPVLPDQLEQAGISWKYYASENAWMNVMQMIRHVRYGPMWDNVLEPSNFVKDVKQGEMPAVSWVIPPESYNEHPGGGKSTCAGENWTVHQVNTIMRSEYWRSTAIVVVWDDFGGFYDPVEPPRYDVMGLGPRTPALIISPYTRQGSNRDGGAVDGTTYEFSSVLAFIERLFGLDPMTDRDARGRPALGGVRLRAPELRQADPAAPGRLPVRHVDVAVRGDAGRCCARSASPATSRRGTSARRNRCGGGADPAVGVPVRNRTPRAAASRRGRGA